VKLSDVPVPSDAEALWRKLRPFKVRPTMYFRDHSRGETNTIKGFTGLVKKVPFESCEKMGYLWSDKVQEAGDEEDRKFIDNVKNNISMEHTIFWGLHTYGGYYGLFRPDLMEIIKLCQKMLRVCKHAYVTTVSCDIDGVESDIGEKCFNSKLDRHYAITTLYPVYG